MNNDTCFDINDVRMSKWISPVGSTIFQCGETAQQVEIASWLYITVLESFKWCNITISIPQHNYWTNASIIQVTILHSLWNYFNDFAISHVEDIQICVTFLNLPVPGRLPCYHRDSRCLTLLTAACCLQQFLTSNGRWVIFLPPMA